MNPITILTEVAETTPEVVEEAQTFGEMLNSNAGIVAFAAGCVLLVGLIAYVGNALAKKHGKKRR